MIRKYFIYDATEDKESNLSEENVERLMYDSVTNFLMNNKEIDSKTAQVTVSLESFSYTDLNGKNKIFFLTHVK